MGEALARGSRITGAQRAELAAQLGRRYAAGESIRAIAEDAGRSFGFVHGLVKEAGVDLRGRGGATRGAGARGAAAPATVPALTPLDRKGPTVQAATTPGQPGGGAKASGKGGAGARGAGSKGGSKAAQPKDAKPKDAQSKDAKAKGKDGKGKDGKGKGKDKKAGGKGGGKR